MDGLITDLEQIKALSATRLNEFEVMRYQLEIHDDITDAELDQFIEKLAAPIIEAIDCTQCANCCRSLDVYLTPEDADQLSARIDISVDSIVDMYIDQEGAEKYGEWGRFAHKPCAFLDGKRCSIYSHRPETCRTYPMLTPDFRWTMEDTIEGAAICPIIYNVLSTLAERIHELYSPPAL